MIGVLNDEWHTWQVSGGDPENDQTYVGEGQIEPPCGVTYQIDRYYGTDEEIQAVIEDGVLTWGEDWTLTQRSQQWYFVTGAPCAPGIEPVELAATGNTLDPWLLVIPVALIVAGLFILRRKP